MSDGKKMLNREFEMSDTRRAGSGTSAIRPERERRGGSRVAPVNGEVALKSRRNARDPGTHASCDAGAIELRSQRRFRLGEARCEVANEESLQSPAPAAEIATAPYAPIALSERA